MWVSYDSWNITLMMKKIRLSVIVQLKHENTQNLKQIFFE